jgi:spermidine synthase
LKDFQIIKYEKFNFKNRYYNAAIHQASFALPNFLQNEI